MRRMDSFRDSAGFTSTQSGPSLLGNASEVVVAAPSTFNSASAIHNVYQLGECRPPSELVLEQRRTAPRSAPELRSEHPSQTYARLMELKGRGLALWYPEPPSGLPDQYRVEGVSIGDVGIVHLDGFFDFLFNICRSSDDPINGGVVPEGFHPLQLSQESRNFQENATSSEPGGYEAAGNISVLETSPDFGYYSFRCCTPGEGAALVLPRGASNKDLLATAQFRQYAAKNAISWYEFAHKKLEREVSNGSIYLVTGHDKASAWGTSCFRDDGSSFDLTFEALRWRNRGLASVKAGPSPTLDRPYNNQSVFLRGFTITLGEGPLERIMGSVHVRPGVPSSARRMYMQESSLEHLNTADWMTNTLFWIMARWRKPSTSSNNQLQRLDVPGVEDVIIASTYDTFSHFCDYDVAVTHDNAWCALVEMSFSPADDTDIMRGLQDSFRISIDDGAVSVQNLEELSQCQGDQEPSLSEQAGRRPIQNDLSGVAEPRVSQGVLRRTSSLGEGGHLAKKPLVSEDLHPQKPKFQQHLGGGGGGGSGGGGGGGGIYYRTELNNIAARHQWSIRYETSTSGPKHALLWGATVFINDQKYAECSGAFSKGAAKEQVAKVAYDVLIPNF